MKRITFILECPTPQVGTSSLFFVILGKRGIMLHAALWVIFGLIVINVVIMALWWAAIEIYGRKRR